MTWGLCTVPNHGEHGSAGAVRRRRAGEANGLSGSGLVKGAVRGLCEAPTMERAKTDAGVFIRNAGLGLIRSSVPEVHLIKNNGKIQKVYLICTIAREESQRIKSTGKKQ